MAQVDTDVFAIILTQGLNRQIRRMCTALGYEVLRLRRERIMHISLEGIAVGKWRNLTNSEVAEIHRLVANSTKTEEGSRLATEAEMTD